MAKTPAPKEEKRPNMFERLHLPATTRVVRHPTNDQVHITVPVDAIDFYISTCCGHWDGSGARARCQCEGGGGFCPCRTNHQATSMERKTAPLHVRSQWPTGHAI